MTINPTNRAPSHRQLPNPHHHYGHPRLARHPDTRHLRVPALHRSSPVETLEPQRALLPTTETGYRPDFMPKNMSGEDSDPATYVEAWLDDAARAKGWVEQEAAIGQYALL